jgi:hypothetical protein
MSKRKRKRSKWELSMFHFPSGRTVIVRGKLARMVISEMFLPRLPRPTPAAATVAAVA